jgi:rfaE bifunctional protein nucleotidyltransferase chain/domain
MNALILDLNACARLADDWRRQGLTLVFTNGHFDLLHGGHVAYLQAARAMGDRLIVGLNSDASTRRRKGPTRPILPQEERAALLAALRAVDAVIVWDEDDFRKVVAALKPDIYVKGADWNRPDGPRPPEAAIVEGYGGRIAYVALTPGRATSAIVREILRRHGCEPEAGT